MPSTLHKTFILGAEILTNCTFKVRILGKDSVKSKNKFYKECRLHHPSRRDI